MAFRKRKGKEKKKKKKPLAVKAPDKENHA
jgi:hypothetical protein